MVRSCIGERSRRLIACVCAWLLLSPNDSALMAAYTAPHAELFDPKLAWVVFGVMCLQCMQLCELLIQSWWRSILLIQAV